MILSPIQLIRVSFLLLVLHVPVSGIAKSKSLPDIKTPNFLSTQLISERPLSLGNLKLASYTFQSSKGNNHIRRFYKKLWDGHIKTVETPDWIYHTNFDGKYLTVIQVRNTQGKTLASYGGGNIKATGLISVSEPGAINAGDIKKKKVELFYPVVPGTVKLSDLSTIDMGRKSRTTVFDVPGGVAQNLQYYQSYFERKGWQEAYSEMAKEMVRNFDGASLIMQKGSNELVLSFIPDRNGRTKVVGVYVDK